MDLIRQDRLPHLWCSGCGHGIVLGAVVRAMERVALPPERTVVVSGIGCSSRAVGYLNLDTLHTTHGRALAFATGIKLARPELNVVVLAGDGDLAAIGGNHLIHAARRNVGITCVCFNNSIYGMTSGQYSPLTPMGARAATAPYGHLERDFDLCRLLQAAGATYVARSTTYHIHQTIEYVARALRHRGFSFVEVLSQCPTYFGRRNRMADPGRLMEWFRERAVPVTQAATMSAEQLQGKVVIGELFRTEAVPEYTSSYSDLIARLGRQGLPASKGQGTGGAQGPEGGQGTEGARQAEGGQGTEGEPVARGRSGRWEVRLAGAGGQGLITAGIILGEAAVRAGLNAVQTQSYGPESRGGASRAEVVLSGGEIDYPKVVHPDLLLVMTQEAFRRYADSVRPGGLVVADADLVKDVAPGPYRVVKVPITRLAREEVGREIVANIVALGVIAALTEVVDQEVIEKAVLDRVPAGTEEMNRRALSVGFQAGQRVAGCLGGEGCHGGQAG